MLFKDNKRSGPRHQAERDLARRLGHLLTYDVAVEESMTLARRMDLMRRGNSYAAGSYTVITFNLRQEDAS